MEKTILSISGKPGLFVLVSRGRSTLIVETMDEQKKRFPVGLRDRVTSLSDVSMYTDDEDVPLFTVFKNIYEKLEGKPIEWDIKKASAKKMEEFMEMALPSYDRDRVYPNDMRKLAQWYNILIKNGCTDFELPKEDVEENTAPEA